MASQKKKEVVKAFFMFLLWFGILAGMSVINGDPITKGITYGLTLISAGVISAFIVNWNDGKGAGGRTIMTWIICLLAIKVFNKPENTHFERIIMWLPVLTAVILAIKEGIFELPGKKKTAEKTEKSG